MSHRLHVTAEEKGIRLDQFLHGQCGQLSRTKIRKIIDLGGVHVDGKRVRKCSFVIDCGQTIELYQDKGSLEPYRIQPEHILYEDEFIIVLNKAAGIETQPTPARYKGTLYEALQHYLRQQTPGKKPQIAMVQRLDRDTSGAIVFSIHKDSHKNLSEQVKCHQLNKEYLALVAGIPTAMEGTFHSFLEYDRNTRRMHSVVSGGKEAITHYKVEKFWNESALVSIQLVTGRTHQIRAHFSEAGHPLLGDIAYGGPKLLEGARWNRQCLHALKLAFTHPVHNKPIAVTAPIPEDMVQANIISK